MQCLYECLLLVKYEIVIPKFQVSCNIDEFVGLLELNGKDNSRSVVMIVRINTKRGIKSKMRRDMLLRLHSVTAEPSFLLEVRLWL
jgi:hypothetical protein